MPSKFTRRVKKIRKNRTLRRGGSGQKSSKHEKDEKKDDKEERQGIIDMIGSKIGDVASSAAILAEDTGLEVIGLERVDKSKEEKETSEKVNETMEKVNENIGEIGDAASGIISDVTNVADKTSSAIIDNVNDVLGSDAVNKSVAEAGKETAEITGELAETFNKAMDDPVVKAEVEEAIENAGEVGAVVAKAAAEPLKEATKTSVEAGTTALGAAAAGLVKVGTDILAAVPGFGAIIDIGKIINDGSRAASAVVEAGSEAVETASDAFIDTTENVKEELKDLEEKKQEAEEISSRTSKSIDEFENPSKSEEKSKDKTGGGRKTKRRLLKHKAKSKRVRFTI